MKAVKKKRGQEAFERGENEHVRGENRKRKGLAAAGPLHVLSFLALGKSRRIWKVPEQPEVPGAVIWTEQQKECEA